ncbi:TetR/AcrR family transcriptional regulator [Amycolatopsis pretoriensis]|uniref:TetR/AcrR family transcriptional regulator n=1 Tax=Amycolatopsis pretoriensis TaxID=218821 RepID=UPI00130247FB|nr:TetR/AcrR family transcriptional regulator [Amycolatopsis pretoriensis]
MGAQTGSSRRERLRAALVADVHAQAYRQIADDSLAAVSMTGIAQNLGLSPAALYRYFPSREELIRALIAESFEASASLTERTLADTAGLEPGLRLRRLLVVTRNWAVDHPIQYRIIQGILGDNRISEADAIVSPERRPFHAICLLVAELPRPEALADALPAAVQGHPGEVMLHALTIWTRLSGVISLELNGVLERMGVDADRFFEAEVDQLLPRTGTDLEPGAANP